MKMVSVPRRKGFVPGKKTTGVTSASHFDAPVPVCHRGTRGYGSSGGGGNWQKRLTKGKGDGGGLMFEFPWGRVNPSNHTGLNGGTEGGKRGRQPARQVTGGVGGVATKDPFGTEFERSCFGGRGNQQRKIAGRSCPGETVWSLIGTLFYRNRWERKRKPTAREG